jgi:hypothetical protein
MLLIWQMWVADHNCSAGEEKPSMQIPCRWSATQRLRMSVFRTVVVAWPTIYKIIPPVRTYNSNCWSPDQQYIKNNPPGEPGGR